MSELTSYRVQDFIPFTEEIYFRLLERMGETFWPLQLLTLVLGAAMLFLWFKNRQQPILLLLAPLWVFVGVAFFMQRYTELNWAGSYIGYAFLVEAGLLVLIPLLGRGIDKRPHINSPPIIAGAALALFGLMGQPLLAPLTGTSWYGAEVFGIHPDPTAIVTLGLVLIALRGIAMWLAAVIPALWILISSLTLQVLDAPGEIILLAVLAVGVVGLVWKTGITTGNILNPS